MDEQPPSQPAEPTEEQLRAAYEEQLRRLRVEDVLVQTVVSLLNLAGRRTGLAPGSEGERDLEQVRKAIEAVRSLLPIVEDDLGPDARQLRDVLSQLQLAYAREAPAGAAQPGGEGSGGEGGEGEPGPGEGGEGGPAPGGQPSGAPREPGPAQRSGRLWVPGQ